EREFNEQEIYSTYCYTRRSSYTIWNVEAIKTSPEWAEVIQLSDDIKRLVTDKWTSEELVYLKTLK
ncbi:hypothetical protein F3247_15160, partial [Listeria monocytogenes]|nr:hypothetical protein [Listeria monocytogenes]